MITPYACLVNIIKLYGGNMLKIIVWCYVIMLVLIAGVLVAMMEGCTDFPPTTRVDGVYDSPTDNITLPLQHPE